METNLPYVKLIKPNIERDAPLSVVWLEGEIGINTLRLMGVNDENNHGTTLEFEKQRIKDFIGNDDQLNWMIEYDGKVVGSIWVELKPTEYLKNPSVHIMIGDPDARGKGIGYSSIETILNYLYEQGYRTVYSRHLTNNSGAISLLESIGFIKEGISYFDKDGIEWQNVVKYSQSQNG